ncbi:MAG TPA: carbon storage regulator [Planctomycetaceae bacterium]|nr:carbon storage regulator [Planctomycetaceae bacterium]
MLVLSRKAEEQIVVGNEVRITVLSVRGNRVRLGIEAPDEMTILRSEAVAVCVDANALGKGGELTSWQA